MVQTLIEGASESPAHFDDTPRKVVVGYSRDERAIARSAMAGRFAAISSMSLQNEISPSQSTADEAELARLWNTLQLNGRRPRIHRDPLRPRINVVDLFCGCGGLSLGIKWAAEAVGTRPVFLLAADVFQAALNLYVRNLRPLRGLRRNIETLVDYETGMRASQVEPDAKTFYLSDELASIAGSVDLFLAGPPCEGNSNFNNRTRRFDTRNDLYLDATVAGIALGAKVIVIENVPTVTRAHQDVVNRSLGLLRNAGYRIDSSEFMLLASEFGTPQVRRRHFLIAGKSDALVSASDFETLKIPAPTALEAITPLQHVVRATTFDKPSQLSDDNMKRVKFLFENDRYDLPNEERPDCHRLKEHSYPSIYGRMRPDEPAPTITTGFLSPGRGRFTHPLEARSLTPHEGARLQGFGEDFDWMKQLETTTRSDYATMIGAAVPPQLGFAVGMCAISLL